MSIIEPPLLTLNAYNLAKKLLLIYRDKSDINNNIPKINRKVGNTDYEKYEKLAKEIEKEEILSKKEILSQINPNDIKLQLQVYQGATKPKLEACKIFKNEGDYYLRNKEYTLSIDAYEKALSQLYYNVTDQEDEKKEVEKIKCSLDLNLSMAFINIKNYKTAMGYLVEAKRLQNNNLKILYRLAYCYMFLNNFDDAKSIINDALKLDNNNKDFLNLLNDVKNKENVSGNVSGKLFRKAFKK